MTQKRSGIRKICLCTIIYSTKRFHYVHIISTVPSSWHTFMVKLTVFSYHFEWIFNRVSCQLHTSIHFSKSFVLSPILLIYVLFSRNNSMPESWVNEKNKKGWAKYKQKIFFIGNIFFLCCPYYIHWILSSSSYSVQIEIVSISTHSFEFYFLLFPTHLNNDMYISSYFDLSK